MEPMYLSFIALGWWRTQDVGLNEELQNLQELLFATNKINPHQSSLSVQLYLRLLCNSLPTRLECGVVLVFVLVKVLMKTIDQMFIESQQDNICRYNCRKLIRKQSPTRRVSALVREIYVEAWSFVSVICFYYCRN